MSESKALLVEIKGVQFRNKGAYLMLLACLQGLKNLKQHRVGVIARP